MLINDRQVENASSGNIKSELKKNQDSDSDACESWPLSYFFLPFIIYSLTPMQSNFGGCEYHHFLKPYFVFDLTGSSFRC